jgi:molybdopterin-guanine dinucleotide biosynthesis protein A
MGRDKALIEVDGVPMACRVAAALRQAGATAVIAVGGDLAALRALGLDARADDHPGEGPLGGILTALRLAGEDIVAVAACDLPSIDPAELAAVVAALDATADAAVPVVDGRLEPLHAAYRARCRPVLAAAFDRGERAVRRALVALSVVEIRPVDAKSLRNVNFPGDLP